MKGNNERSSAAQRTVSKQKAAGTRRNKGAKSKLVSPTPKRLKK